MVEDVGFDILPIPASLQEENVGASGIHTQEFGIFTGIEMSVSTDETVIMGEHMCTRMDKVLAVNFDPFGACACCNGSPCTAPVIDWTHVTDKIRLGGNLLLLENSELLCSLGGRIRIFYTLAAASAACGASREEERSFWSKAIDFGKGLGKGLWKGLKGTVTGVIDLGIWAGKHSLPYMLLDPAGFADQLKQDGEILKSLGNLAGKAGTWMYRNSAVNLLANPQDFLAAQQENRAMLETLADKAANMSAEEWGDFAGQVLFEVGTEVATAGGAAALTAVKAADKVVDVAKVANRVDDVLDTVKALDKIDDAADAAKALDKAKVPKLTNPVMRQADDIDSFKLLDTEGNVGSFDELVKAGTMGDNITPHHMPSAKYLEINTDIKYKDGVAMNMEQPSPGKGGRHRKTSTYNNNMTNAEQQSYWNLSPREALAHDINDAIKIYKEQGLYNDKIREGLLEVIIRNKEKYPDLFKK